MTISETELTGELKYRLLREIFYGIQDTLDLEEILEHLLDVVDQLLSYDAGGIFVLNQELVQLPYQRPRQVIAGLARRGFDSIPLEQDPMLALGRGIIGSVIDSGEPVVLGDVREDPRYVVGRGSTRSEIAVPIMQKGRAIGAFNLESDELGAFTENDVEVLHFFADAAAISIEKALLHQQILEKERMERQLHIAQEVQARLLPEGAPTLPGYEIAGLCLPTYEIGGDAFDYIPLADGRLALVVADVSGKGVPAALIMTAFRSLVRARAQQAPEPGALAAAVNSMLLETTAQMDFVTCVYGVLEADTGRFDYANCGHNPPLLLRGGSRQVEQLHHGDLVLGMFERATCQPQTVTLAPGDLLLLYTDGVVECENRQGADFGVRRLARAAQRAHGARGKRRAEAVTQEIVRATQVFTGVERYADDFTLVAVARQWD